MRSCSPRTRRRRPARSGSRSDPRSCVTAGSDAIKTAFLTAGTVATAVLDQKRTISGAQGPLGDFAITNFSRSESLAEAIVADVTAKLARFEEWYEVA